LGRSLPLWRRALALVVALAIVGGSGSYVVAHPWPGIALVAFVAGMFGLVIVQSTSESAKAWLDRVGKLLGRALGHVALWFVIAFGPIVAARYAAEAVVDVPLGVAVALLLVWLAAFAFLVLQVWSERRRRSLYRRWRQIDRVTPFLYPFGLTFVAIILFATLAFVLAERELIRFGSGPESATAVAEPADALDFFLWHLVDSVPGFDVTHTLRWKEPLGYTDSRVGLLLLVFKIVVIAPIVATFLGFWRYSREPSPGLPRGMD
jgi:hypothetical protein